MDPGVGQGVRVAVADDLPVQRVELIHVVLDDDDVALGDVELPGDRRTVERILLEHDGILHAVQQELGIAGGHRVHVAAARPPCWAERWC